MGSVTRHLKRGKRDESLEERIFRLPAMITRRRSDDGRFLFVSQGSLDLLGYAASDLEGHDGPSFEDLVHPDDRQRVAGEIRSGIRGGKPLRLVYRVLTAEGKTRRVLERCLFAGGAIEGIMFDPAPLVEMEDLFRAEEERYKAMMDASFDGIAIHDKGVILDCNTILAQELGYERDEIIGKPIIDLIAEEDREDLLARVRSGYSETYEVRGKRKDGLTFPGQIRGKDIVFQGKPIRVAAVRDISIFRAAEKALEGKVAERTADIQRMHQALLRELAMARKVQESLLPDAAAWQDEISIATAYQPALEVGGDAYNIIRLRDGALAALVADVTGHGIRAALSTVLVTSTFSCHAGEDVTPRQILRNMNGALRKGLPSGTFAAAIVATLDPSTGRGQILNAGLPDPLVLRRSTGDVEALSCRSPLLGVLDEGEYEGMEGRPMELKAEDCLLLTTDGLHEVRNEEGEFFGDRKLREAFLRSGGASHPDLPHRIVSEARAFSGPYHSWDDITILSLKRP